MNLEINRHLLRADIRAISLQLRALKGTLGSTWRRPMASEQRLLCQLKQRATELCELSAFSHGRCHLQRAPRAAPPDWNRLVHQRLIVERLGPSYAAVLEESA